MCWVLPVLFFVVVIVNIFTDMKVCVMLNIYFTAIIEELLFSTCIYMLRWNSAEWLNRGTLLYALKTTEKVFCVKFIYFFHQITLPLLRSQNPQIYSKLRHSPLSAFFVCLFVSANNFRNYDFSRKQHWEIFRFLHCKLIKAHLQVQVVTAAAVGHQPATSPSWNEPWQGVAPCPSLSLVSSGNTNRLHAA